jgi:hypothetical protein
MACGGRKGFRSKAQARLMFAKHPRLAKKMAGGKGSIKRLPQHAKAKRRK